jgi:hypothetical protein
VVSENIRERIRRLLALSESGNVHEAAAAAAKAQELMSKHSIDQAELAEQAGEVDEPLCEEDLQFFGARIVPWRGLLASSLARANGCDCYNQVWRCGDDKRTRAISRILGPASAVQAVRYMLAYLEREIGRLVQAERAEGRSSAAWLNSFRLGASYEIGRRVTVAAAAAKASAAGHGCALARIDRDASRVAEAMAAKTLGAGRKPSIRNSQAFLSGLVAGRTVGIGSGPALPSGPVGALRSES